VAYSLLDPTAQGLFLLMGALFTDHIGLPLLSAISNVPERTLQGLLRSLVKRGLCRQVERPGEPPIFSTHEFARVFARKMLHGQGKLETIRDRILGGTLTFVQRHTDQTSSAAYDALALEMDNFWGMARFAAGVGRVDVLEALFKMLGQHGTQNVIHARGFEGFYDALGRLLSEGASRAAEMPGNAAATSSGAVETVELPVEKPAEPLASPTPETAAPQLEQVETPASAEQPLDPIQRGQTLLITGDAQRAAGAAHDALETYRQAAAAFQQGDDGVSEGLALSKAADVLMDKGKFQEATLALAQAAGLFEQGERRDLQGRALGNLGTAFGRLGHWREAGQRHALALQIARDLGDLEDERFQLTNLAFVAESEGHYEWAVHYNRQALYLALVAGDREATATIALELGRLLLSDTNQLTQAIRLLEASVDFAQTDEGVRLLHRARIRHERLVSSGYGLPPAEIDLQTYAQAAYEMK
jgi:tetratricopeptide (TPR) repeat protein